MSADCKRGDKMTRAFILVLFGLAALPGCIERPGGVTQLPLEFPLEAAALSVRARVDGQGLLTEGQTLPVHVTITNVSEGPAVLGHVEAHVGRSSAVYGWRPRIYGSVAYDEGAHLYRLNELAQMEAVAADWTNGLLLPRETLECTVPVEVLEVGSVPSGFSLAYYAGAFEEMALKIYIEGSRDGFDVAYGRSTPEELRALAEAEAVFQVSRLVIYRTDSEPLTVKTEATLNVAAAPFSSEEAMTRAGFRTERFAHSEKEGGWVLEAPDGVVLVTPEEVKRYPGCTLAVWKFAEAAEDTVYFWYLVDDEALHALFRPYDFLEGKGFHAYVPRGKALALIERAYQAGYRSQMSDFQFTPCISFEALTEPSG